MRFEKLEDVFREEIKSMNDMSLIFHIDEYRAIRECQALSNYPIWHTFGKLLDMMYAECAERLRATLDDER